ncbi:hypothetical protein LI328DRAFT_164380 [Trichoderma asperelloides]|nr:hypothetical protein LI328DRAFT_164380 [Trichoderma asperelloides]
MLVAAQPHVNPGWGRWPQQTSPSFPVMSSPGFTSYDPRSQVSSHIQRQVSPPYLMSSTYNHSPISAVSPPQYHSHSAFSYMPYHSPPPSTPLGAPFKAEFREQPYMVTEASAVDQRNLQSMKEYQPYSPISRRESVSSNTHSHITPGPATPGSFASGPISLSPIAPSSFIVARLDNSKTLSYNETLDPADKIDFKTDVDELMKAIQGSRSKGDYEQLPTPAPTPEYVATPPSTLPTQSGKPRKQWICDGPNCGRAFTQKTHRDIHQRTHTGHRPYVCDKAGCGLTFSQRGNLRTHIRRHTGEKPYRCSQCTKSFAQRGNLRSHEETHKGLKPFVCRLDDCNKAFSQLGNMKTHQNNFHKATLKKLIALFVQFSEEGEVPEAYRELFDYFQKHYKNSNKGVKGRGKTRAVTARGPLHSVASQVSQLALPAQDPVVSSSPYTIPPGSTNILSSVLRNPNPSYSLYGPGSSPQMGPSSHLPY